MILAFSKLFTFANLFLSSIMIVDGKYLTRLYRTLITLVLNSSFGFVLGLKFGISGVALSVLLTQALSVLFLNYVYKDTRIYFKCFTRSLLLWK
uniref:polysaccharide biosynthesis C-terminal domain-containing protein n=1 Tax=Vibrio campbellii TaxID=680 RepID=UPI00398A1A0C